MLFQVYPLSFGVAYDRKLILNLVLSISKSCIKVFPMIIINVTYIVH